MTAKLEPLAGQRQSGESQKAIQACNDWLRLGPGRTLTKLHKIYIETPENAPTKSLTTIGHWSKDYNWSERATIFDIELERLKNERRREIMENGLALDYERVNELRRLADFLIDQIYEQGEGGDFHNVWVPDVKQIGSGQYAERVDIEKFNPAILSELRGALDDLAKETGGRKQKVEHSGTIDSKLVIMPSKD